MSTKKKHPYGRIATLRYGALCVAQGLTVLLTAGEISPTWTLEDALRNTYKARKGGKV